LGLLQLLCYYSRKPTVVVGLVSVTQLVCHLLN
jgi:hypothetical protein